MLGVALNTYCLFGCRELTVIDKDTGRETITVIPAMLKPELLKFMKLTNP